MDRIVGEVFNAQCVFSSQHLPRADGVEDFYLVRRETFGVDQGFLFNLGVGLRLGEVGGGFDVLDEHGGFHFLHDGGLFVWGVVFECVETEVYGLGDFLLAELAAYIGCTLDDYKEY